MADKARDLHCSLFPNKPFQITFKTTSQMTALIKPEGSYNKTNTKDNKDLSAIGVVYHITCKKCKEQGKCADYVGETSRPLINKIREHLSIIKDEEDLKKKENVASALQIHIYKEHRSLKIEDLDVKILKNERKTQARKIYEAMHIRKLKPNLNNNQGVDLVI
jgi:hypothetical protein